MSKSISRTVATKPSRVKTAVVISPEAFRRLGAACLAENMTQSDIVEMLINRTLSGYVVSVRGTGIHAGPVASTVSTVSNDRQTVSCEISLDASEAA